MTREINFFVRGLIWKKNENVYETLGVDVDGNNERCSRDFATTQPRCASVLIAVLSLFNLVAFAVTSRALETSMNKDKTKLLTVITFLLKAET